MITMDNKQFEGNEFAIQIMAKGNFVDTAAAPGKVFIVEAITIRLNWVALNEWLLSSMSNVRECYKDGTEGDAEWEAHKVEYKQKREAVRNKIISDLGISEGSVCIEQAHSEVFTVVNCRECLKKETVEA
jgi:hypothetical protein